MQSTGADNLGAVVRSRKRLITLVLALAGVGVIVVYPMCGSSCAYLRGSIFGIDLKYAGIMGMAAVMLSNMLKKDSMLVAALSAGLGAEIFLVAFQIRHGTYCPFCLAFGAIVVLQFLLNLDLGKKALVTSCLVLGYLIFAVFFKGSVTPTYDLGGMSLPSPAYGQVCLGSEQIESEGRSPKVAGEFI
jgi:hypothetical protein